MPCIGDGAFHRQRNFNQSPGTVMAKTKPKIAARVIGIKSDMDPMKIKRFGEAVQVMVTQALSKLGLQGEAKTREGYDLRLALEGPKVESGDGGKNGVMRLSTELFLLSAETGKRIANESFGAMVRFEDGAQDKGLNELNQQLCASHAVKRIAAAALKDAEDLAGAKKKK